MHTIERNGEIELKLPTPASWDNGIKTDVVVQSFDVIDITKTLELHLLVLIVLEIEFGYTRIFDPKISILMLTKTFPCSNGSTALRQLNSIHKKGPKFFKKKQTKKGQK